jgi:predicted nucleic acid-binding protein
MSLSPKNTRASASGVFMDANILLEVILSRPREAVARQVLTRHANSLYISSLTAHLVVHFGTERTDLSVLRKFLTDYTILPLTDADFDWAFANIADDDFEDALQLSVAINGGCGRFITFDKALVKAYQNRGLIGIELAR